MIAGIFDEFFGVPTHPLAVHAPVVLVPMGAIVALVLAWKAQWRARLGWWTVGAVFVLVVSLFVAKESGESLLESGNVLGNPDEHVELADATFAISLVWFAVTALLVGRDWQLRRAPAASLSSAASADRRDIATTVLAVLWALLGVVTTIWLIRTGHAGAESRWVA